LLKTTTPQKTFSEPLLDLTQLSPAGKVYWRRQRLVSDRRSQLELSAVAVSRIWHPEFIQVTIGPSTG